MLMVLVEGSLRKDEKWEIIFFVTHQACFVVVQSKLANRRIQEKWDIQNGTFISTIAVTPISTANAEKQLNNFVINKHYVTSPINKKKNNEIQDM